MTIHKARRAPEIVVAAAERGRWEVRAVGDQQHLGHAGTQLGAIEIALARLRDAGGGRLAVQSPSGRVEVRTVTADGTLLPA